MNLLCMIGLHKFRKTTRRLLTADMKVIESPTVRCKGCGKFQDVAKERMVGEITAMCNKKEEAKDKIVEQELV